MALLVGVAGWSIPREARDHFPEVGSHLQRYASRLPAVEINSSFYREHRPATYRRWAECVPPDFRFSVKVPRTITHQARLRDAEPLLDAFLPGPLSLGEKLGCLLIQLPPKLDFEPGVAPAFLRSLRERFARHLVLEPRHPTWFTPAVEVLLHDLRIARVAADPPRAPGDGVPAAWPGIVYHRLHGSPRIYYSAYPPDFIESLAGRITDELPRDIPVWCIFDNTALGAAPLNALELRARLAEHQTAG